MLLVMDVLVAVDVKNLNNLGIFRLFKIFNFLKNCIDIHAPLLYTNKVG